MIQVVRGDLLRCDEPIIVQQLNCLCTKPHGLAEDIARRYPYADVYSKRKSIGRRNLAVEEDRGKVGEIVVSTPSDPSLPIVVGLYGQYDYGSHRTIRRRTPIECDSPQLREQWFAQSLERLKEFVGQYKFKTIGFPFKIGCGLAGGDWNNYYDMIEQFAQEANIQVNIYRL